MEYLFTFESLAGWVQYLREKYDGLSVSEICNAENIHLLIEPLPVNSYEWIEVDNTSVLILNSALRDADKKMWLIGALAEKHMKTGNKLMIRFSKN
jgi:hypothetical protein